MAKGIATAEDARQIRRQTMVSDRVLCSTMAALAAVIEEPYCILGVEELRGVVLAFNALDRASGAERLEYVFRDGCAVMRASGEILKQGLPAPVVAGQSAVIDKSADSGASSGESKNA